MPIWQRPTQNSSFTVYVPPYSLVLRVVVFQRVLALEKEKEWQQAQIL